MRTITTTYLTIPGTEIEFEVPPGLAPYDDSEVLAVPAGDGSYHVGWLCSDDAGDTEDPINYDTGETGPGWSFVDFTSGTIGPSGIEARDEHLAAVIETHGVDCVFLVDRMEHGLCRYSLSAPATDPWDTCYGSGVLTVHPETDPAKRAEYAASALENYTSWANGDVYGVVSLSVTTDGDAGDDDSCWGFIGHEYATSELRYTLGLPVE